MFFFCAAKMSDDTVYYEPVESEETLQESWVIPSARETEVEQYTVVRRRSRSVGSRPLFIRKPAAPTSTQQ